MFQIPAAVMVGVKWFAILAIFSGVGYGIKWVYNKHLEAIDDAINQVKLEAAIEKETIVRKVTAELKAEQEAERKIMEAELELARSRSDDLRRMLTIDHDLDRLLQRKPGLVLPRVNDGTEEVLKELEELTR